MCHTRKPLKTYLLKICQIFEVVPISQHGLHGIQQCLQAISVVQPHKTFLKARNFRGNVRKLLPQNFFIPHSGHKSGHHRMPLGYAVIGQQPRGALPVLQGSLMQHLPPPVVPAVHTAANVAVRFHITLQQHKGMQPIDLFQQTLFLPRRQILQNVPAEPVSDHRSRIFQQKVNGFRMCRYNVVHGPPPCSAPDPLILTQ